MCKQHPKRIRLLLALLFFPHASRHIPSPLSCAPSCRVTLPASRSAVCALFGITGYRSMLSVFMCSFPMVFSSLVQSVPDYS